MLSGSPRLPDRAVIHREANKIALRPTVPQEDGGLQCGKVVRTEWLPMISPIGGKPESVHHGSLQSLRQYRTHAEMSCYSRETGADVSLGQKQTSSAPLLNVGYGPWRNGAMSYQLYAGSLTSYRYKTMIVFSAM
jgi:hypothetical protein